MKITYRQSLIKILANGLLSLFIFPLTANAYFLAAYDRDYDYWAVAYACGSSYDYSLSGLALNTVDNAGYDAIGGSTKFSASDNSVDAGYLVVIGAVNSSGDKRLGFGIHASSPNLAKSQALSDFWQRPDDYSVLYSAYLSCGGGNAKVSGGFSPSDNGSGGGSSSSASSSSSSLAPQPICSAPRIAGYAPGATLEIGEDYFQVEADMEAGCSLPIQLFTDNSRFIISVPYGSSGVYSGEYLFRTETDSRTEFPFRFFVNSEANLTLGEEIHDTLVMQDDLRSVQYRYPIKYTYQTMDWLQIEEQLVYNNIDNYVFLKNTFTDPVEFEITVEYADTQQLLDNFYWGPVCDAPEGDLIPKTTVSLEPGESKLFPVDLTGLTLSEEYIYCHANMIVTPLGDPRLRSPMPAPGELLRIGRYAYHGLAPGNAGLSFYFFEGSQEYKLIGSNRARIRTSFDSIQVYTDDGIVEVPPESDVVLPIDINSLGLSSLSGTPADIVRLWPLVTSEDAADKPSWGQLRAKILKVPGAAADFDSDGDGVSDTDDAYPLDEQESMDSDGDGIGDNTDTDDDGDGYEDSFDRFPLDPTEWADYDNDGIGDNSDDTPWGPVYPCGDLLGSFNNFAADGVPIVTVTEGSSVSIDLTREARTAVEINQGCDTVGSLDFYYSLEPENTVENNHQLIDFTTAARSGSLTFMDVNQEESIELVTQNDDYYNANRRYTLKLVSPQNKTIQYPNVYIDVVDDEPSVTSTTVSLLPESSSATEYRIGEGDAFNLYVERAGDTRQALKVDLTIQPIDGVDELFTITEGKQLEPFVKSIVLAPGVSSNYIQLQSIDNTLLEYDAATARISIAEVSEGFTIDPDNSGFELVIEDDEYSGPQVQEGVSFINDCEVREHTDGETYAFFQLYVSDEAGLGRVTIQFKADNFYSADPLDYPNINANIWDLGLVYLINGENFVEENTNSSWYSDARDYTRRAFAMRYRSVLYGGPVTTYAIKLSDDLAENEETFALRLLDASKAPIYRSTPPLLESTNYKSEISCTVPADEEDTQSVVITDGPLLGEFSYIVYRDYYNEDSLAEQYSLNLRRTGSSKERVVVRLTPYDGFSPSAPDQNLFDDPRFEAFEVYAVFEPDSETVKVDLGWRGPELNDGLYQDYDLRAAIKYEIVEGDAVFDTGGRIQIEGNNVVADVIGFNDENGPLDVSVTIMERSASAVTLEVNTSFNEGFEGVPTDIDFYQIYPVPYEIINSDGVVLMQGSFEPFQNDGAYVGTREIVIDNSLELEGQDLAIQIDSAETGQQKSWRMQQYSLDFALQYFSFSDEPVSSSSSSSSTASSASTSSASSASSTVSTSSSSSTSDNSDSSSTSSLDNSSSSSSRANSSGDSSSSSSRPTNSGGNNSGGESGGGGSLGPVMTLLLLMIGLSKTQRSVIVGRLDSY